MKASDVADIAKVLRDESSVPFEGLDDLSLRYNKARLVWQAFHYSRFELSEISRRHLSPFLLEKKIGDTNGFYHSDIDPDLRYINAICGDFTFQCNGSNTVRTLPISRRQITHGLEALHDPNAQPDDTDPQSIESGDEQGEYTKILSTNVPKNVIVLYLKRPKAIDIVNYPNQPLLEKEEGVHEIVNFVLKSIAYTVDDYAKFQATNQLETF